MATTIMAKDTFTLNLMLSKACTVEDAEHIFYSMPNRDIVSWNTILGVYARHSHHDKAWSLFQTMPYHNQISWTTTLLVHAESGNLLEMENLFAAMPHRDLISWNALLGAYTKAGYVAESKNLFEKMPLWNLVSYTSIVSLHGQCGSLAQAKIMFDSMPEHNVVSWNSMLAAYARQGHLVDARDAFDHMPATDRFSWTTLLVAYCDNGRMDCAVEVYKTMPERCVVSWNAMLTAYAEAGHLEDAEGLFENMLEHSIVSWTAMLTAYGMLEHAIRVYSLMPLHNVVALNAMLDGLAWIGHHDADLAKRFFDRMPQRDQVSWNTMLCAFLRSRQIDAARSIFMAMPRDEISWTAMIAAMAQVGLLDSAAALFDSMPEPGIVAQGAMLAGLAAAGRSAEVINRFHELQTVLDPRPLSFLAVIIACNHSGKAIEGTSYVRSMAMDFGLEPAKQHYCCVVDLLGRAGHLDFAEDLVAGMPYEPTVPSLLGSSRESRDSGRQSRLLGRLLALDRARGGVESASVVMSSIHYLG